MYKKAFLEDLVMEKLLSKKSFSIKRKKLLTALRKISNASERKSAFPILSSVKISNKNGILELTATDLEVQASVQIKMDIYADFELCLPITKLINIVSLLPDENINFEIDDKARIKSGKSKFTLPFYNPEDFPLLSDEDLGFYSFEINEKTLKKAIKNIQYAVSKEEHRYSLEGIFIKSYENKVDFVGSDGHRLSLYSIETDIENEISTIIPAKAVSELLKLIDDDTSVKVYANPSYVIFKSDNWKLITRQLEGSYIDYKTLIENNLEKLKEGAVFKADRNKLLEIIQRVSIISATNSNIRPLYIKLKYNSLIVSAKGEDGAFSEEDLNVEVINPAEPELKVNAAYLIEALKNLEDEKIEFSFLDENTPVIITAEKEKGFLGLIMPMNM